MPSMKEVTVSGTERQLRQVYIYLENTLSRQTSHLQNEDVSEVLLIIYKTFKYLTEKLSGYNNHSSKFNLWTFGLN